MITSIIISGSSSNVLNTLRQLFEIADVAADIIDSIWRNGSGFEIFLVLISLVYFLPVNTIIKERFGFSAPLILKILLHGLTIMEALSRGMV